jgi:hypothetical protein
VRNLLFSYIAFVANDNVRRTTNLNGKVIYVAGSGNLTVEKCVFRDNVHPIFSGSSSGAPLLRSVDCWSYDAVRTSGGFTYILENMRVGVVPYSLSVCSLQRVNSIEATGCTIIYECPPKECSVQEGERFLAERTVIESECIHIRQCVFQDCALTTGTAQGGAIYLNDPIEGNSEIVECFFINCWAGPDSSTLYGGAGYISTTFGVLLRDNCASCCMSYRGAFMHLNQGFYTIEGNQMYNCSTVSSESRWGGCFFCNTLVTHEIGNTNCSNCDGDDGCIIYWIGPTVT